MTKKDLQLSPDELAHITPTRTKRVPVPMTHKFADTTSLSPFKSPSSGKRKKDEENDSNNEQTDEVNKKQKTYNNIENTTNTSNGETSTTSTIAPTPDKSLKFRIKLTNSSPTNTNNTPTTTTTTATTTNDTVSPSKETIKSPVTKKKPAELEALEESRKEKKREERRIKRQQQRKAKAERDKAEKERQLAAQATQNKTIAENSNEDGNEEGDGDEGDDDETMEDDELLSTPPLIHDTVDEEERKREKKRKDDAEEAELKATSADRIAHCKKQFSQLLSNLMKKDTHGFFYSPVTEQIAPNYFKYIKEPMDFETMSKKVKQGKYISTDRFLYDFALICENCMKYNDSNSVYYKDAKRLLTVGKPLIQQYRTKVDPTDKTGTPAFNGPITAVPSAATLRERERKANNNNSASNTTTTSSVVANDYPPHLKKESRSSRRKKEEEEVVIEEDVVEEEEEEVAEEEVEEEFAEDEVEEEEVEEEEVEDEQVEEEAEEEVEEEGEKLSRYKQKKQAAQAIQLAAQQAAAAQQALLHQQQALLQQQQQAQQAQQQHMQISQRSYGLPAVVPGNSPFQQNVFLEATQYTQRPTRHSIPMRKYIKLDSAPKVQSPPESLKTSFTLIKSIGNDDANVLISPASKLRPTIYNMYVPITPSNLINGSYQVLGQNIEPNYLKIVELPSIIPQPPPQPIRDITEPMIIEPALPSSAPQSTSAITTFANEIQVELSTATTTTTEQPVESMNIQVDENHIVGAIQPPLTVEQTMQHQISQAAIQQQLIAQHQQAELQKMFKEPFIPNQELVLKYGIDKPVLFNEIQNYLSIKYKDGSNDPFTCGNNDSSPTSPSSVKQSTSTSTSTTTPISIESIPNETLKFFNQQMSNLMNRGSFNFEDGKLKESISNKCSNYIENRIAQTNVSDTFSVDTDQFKQVGDLLKSKGVDLEFLNSLIVSTPPSITSPQQQSVNNNNTNNNNNNIEPMVQDVNNNSNTNITTTTTPSSIEQEQQQKIHQEEREKINHILRENYEELFRLQVSQYHRNGYPRATEDEYKKITTITENIKAIGLQLPPSALIYSHKSLRQAIAKSGLFIGSGRKPRLNDN